MTKVIEKNNERIKSVIVLANENEAWYAYTRGYFCITR